jgi:hypothetical protein
MTEEEKDQNTMAEPTENQPEEANKVLKSRFASDIATRGGGNRVVGVLEKASKIMGMPVDDDTATKFAEEKKQKEELKALQPKVVLGRGAWAAIVCLFIFIPLLAWAIATIINMDSQIRGYRSNFSVLQDTQSRDAQLIQLVTNPTTKVYRLANNEPQSTSQVNLHVADSNLWGMSFNGINSINAKDRQMAVWAVRKTPKAGASDYQLVTQFGGGGTTAGFFIINREAIPNLNEFAGLIVSDEPLNQELGTKPTGGVFFRLDMTQIKY